MVSIVMPSQTPDLSVSTTHGERPVDDPLQLGDVDRGRPAVVAVSREDGANRVLRSFLRDGRGPSTRQREDLTRRWSGNVGRRTQRSCVSVGCDWTHVPESHLERRSAGPAVSVLTGRKCDRASAVRAKRDAGGGRTSSGRRVSRPDPCEHWDHQQERRKRDGERAEDSPEPR